METDVQDLVVQVSLRELAKVVRDDLLDMCEEDVMNTVEQRASGGIPRFCDRYDVFVGHDVRIMVWQLASDGSAT